MAKQTTTTAGRTASGSRPARPRAAGGAGSGSAAIGRGISRPSLTAFFEASWAELKKVTWPTRQETQNLTLAVIAMTLAVAAFLGVVDAGLDGIVKLLIPH